MEPGQSAHGANTAPPGLNDTPEKRRLLRRLARLERRTGYVTRRAPFPSGGAPRSRGCVPQPILPTSLRCATSILPVAHTNGPANVPGDFRSAHARLPEGHGARLCAGAV